MTARELTADERQRYGRHLLLPGVGEAGQQRLANARVLIVGAGGLGSPVAMHLAAAGVGTIGLVDHDVVDASNLHRQLLYGTADVGRPKLEAAAARLHDLNPHVTVRRHDTWLTSANALDILRDYEVVVDGTDNFATRYLVNDACVLLGIPNVHGAVHRFDGQVSVFATRDGPCYRCLHPTPPPPGTVPSCAEGGVLGVLPGLVGTLQATEAIKLLLGLGESLAGRLLLVDTRHMQMHTVRVARDPQCAACGARTITQLGDYAAWCGAPGPGEGAQSSGVAVPEISAAELRQWLDASRPLQLVDVREPNETAQGMIATARAVPLGQVAAAHATWSRDVPIVLVCSGGVRSARAARQLLDAGFVQVYSLTGGMAAWSRGPVVPS